MFPLLKCSTNDYSGGLSCNSTNLGSGSADFEPNYRLKRSKKEARAQKTEVSSKMENLRKKLKEVKTAEDAIESNLSAMCISGRNEYSKGRSPFKHPPSHCPAGRFMI